MMFKSTPILLVLLFLQLTSISAQHSWYENSMDVHHLILNKDVKGTFTTNQSNPKTDGLNTNALVSKFVRNGNGNSFAVFRLPNPIKDVSGLSITLKAYISMETSSLTTENNTLRIELRNSRLGAKGSINEQVEFSEGETWASFSFDFDGANISPEILEAGGFNLMRIGFAVGYNPAQTSYYIDAIEGSVSQLDTTVYADFLAGSWGVTFPVFGGTRLDAEVAGGYDLVSGAQEIVDELPETGHIITNLSYFAHSHYFTLSKNENVDLAKEIHPDLVPTAPNDEIIFDVLNILKDAGKKIILYIHVGYLDDADPEIQVAWQNYYNTNFNGDEYAAYEYMIKGFIEEVKDYADGYWLDGAGTLYDDGRLDDFHAMIRSTDRDAAISIQGNAKYFTDDAGNNLLVDSDGLDDADSTDYRIIGFIPQVNLGNYTGGHVTPLQQGAPPNSWAYEEFTIPNMIEEPLIDFDGRPIVKHGWFPMRDRWHSPHRPLMFVDAEQVYRFTRKITDANAGVTFASTTTDIGDKKGYMMADEMAKFKVVNERLAMANPPDFVPYERPIGAYLVGEEDSTTSIDDVTTNLEDLSLFPNPVKAVFSLSKEVASGALYNVSGAKTYEFYNQYENIDISNLHTGFYLLHVRFNDGSKQTLKLIKE